MFSVGDEFISAQLSWVNRSQVALGLISHAAGFAKYSPGTLHLLLAAQLTQEEGFKELDLTPEGEYKERFASEFDQPYIATVYFRRHQRLLAAGRSATRSCLKHALALARVDPPKIDRRMRHNIDQLLRAPGSIIPRVWNRGRQWVGSHKELRVYRFDLAGRPLPPNPALMRRDSIEDILVANSDPRQFDRDKFLKNALRRIEQGQHCYVRSEGGMLVHYGWMVEGEERSVSPK